MKQFDLTNLGVQELNEQELLAVEGGNVFKKIGAAVVTAANAVADAAVAVAGAVVAVAKHVWENGWTVPV